MPMFRTGLLTLLVSIAVLALLRLALVTGALVLAALQPLLVPPSVPQIMIESVLLFALAASAGGLWAIRNLDYATM